MEFALQSDLLLPPSKLALLPDFAPRPYQEIMRDFELNVYRGNVWAEPGLGKTGGTLTALDLLWIAGSHYWPALVIGPKRVARGVWTAEAHKWRDFAHL